MLSILLPVPFCFVSIITQVFNICTCIFTKTYTDFSSINEDCTLSGVVRVSSLQIAPTNYLLKGITCLDTDTAVCIYYKYTPFSGGNLELEAAGEISACITIDDSEDYHKLSPCYEEEFRCATCNRNIIIQLQANIILCAVEQVQSKVMKTKLELSFEQL